MSTDLSAATRAALAEGVALFDQGRFHTAHEVWEDAWRGETGEVRELLQGLIQVAAGFHKGLVQQVPSGMVRLLARALGHLERARDQEVPLERLRTGVEAWRAAAQRWAEGGQRPDLPVPRLGHGSP